MRSIIGLVTVVSLTNQQKSHRISSHTIAQTHVPPHRDEIGAMLMQERRGHVFEVGEPASKCWNSPKLRAALWLHSQDKRVQYACSCAPVALLPRRGSSILNGDYFGTQPHEPDGAIGRPRVELKGRALSRASRAGLGHRIYLGISSLTYCSSMQ